MYSSASPSIFTNTLILAKITASGTGSVMDGRGNEAPAETSESGNAGEQPAQN